MYKDLPPFSVKVRRFANGERSPLVYDANGIIARAPSLYALISLRPREGSSGTLEADLRAVTLLLNWAADRKIDLEARLSSVRLLDTFEIESLRDHLRARRRRRGKNASSVVIGAATFVTRCRICRDYVAWHARIAIQRMSNTDVRVRDATRKLEQFERAMVADLPSVRSSDEREGIDESAQRLFLSAIEPGNELNPFPKQHQHRNHALLLLYYELSIRRSEGLVLTGADLALHGSNPSIWIRRRPDNAADQRTAEPKVKTLGRNLVVSPQLASALHTWVVKHRSDATRYPGAKRIPFVFVTRRGAMSLRLVNNLFEQLRSCVPGLPADLVPHLLRHTGNDRFTEGAKKLGLSEAEEQQRRNYAMGWSKHSKQGARYTRRSVRLGAAEVMQTMTRRDERSGEES